MVSAQFNPLQGCLTGSIVVDVGVGVGVGVGGVGVGVGVGIDVLGVDVDVLGVVQRKFRVLLFRKELL